MLSIFVVSGCTKEVAPTSNETKQEQSTKPEEAIKEVAKEEETLKLEAWESDKINQATAEEFFFKHAQKLHSFKPELLDEYLAYIKPMMVEDRYQYFEKSFKNAQSQKVTLEYVKATMTKIEKAEWSDIKGYQIFYDITYKENGAEKTEKALAQLKVINGEFKINDYWQNP